MSSSLTSFYEFGPFLLDPSLPLLLRNGEPVPLPPKALETLVALVERGGEVVRREELIEIVWPDTVVEENNLSVNVSALRKALGETEDGKKYIETVPRRGYRFLQRVKVSDGDEGGSAGQDRVTYQSPLLDGFTSPDAQADAGLARTNGHAADETNLSRVAQAPLTEATHSIPRALQVTRTLALHRVSILVGAAALVVAASVVGYFYIARDSRVTADQGAINSVAVMTFINVGNDPEMEYLSDGITESLINRLSLFPKLKVMSCNSVFHYKGRETDAQAIGRELGVHAVLTGSVVQRGDNLSISVELVDAADNRHLWGERYERKLSDVLTVQREITHEITEKLRLPLTGVERKLADKVYTENAEAYQLYLKGRYFWNKRTGEGFKKGIEYFNQAIERDPNYALAYSGLADSYSLLSEYDVMNAKEAYPKASDAAVRALAIDDELAEAHASFAVIKAAYVWDWSGAEREYQRAIHLKPNYAPAHQWYAEYLSGMGRHDEAFAEIKRAQELDPLSLITNAVVAWVLYFARRNDEVVTQCERVLEMDADFAEVYPFLGRAYEQKGMFEEALAAFQKRRTLLGFRANGNHGDRASRKILDSKAYWLKRLRRLEEEEKTKFGLGSAHRWAECWAQLGDKDQAFTWLEKAYAERSYWLMYLKVAPNLDNLRSDPRFADLLRRVGLES